MKESATSTFRVDKPCFTVKVEVGRSSDNLVTPLPDNMASVPTRHQYLSLISEGGIGEIYAKPSNFVQLVNSLLPFRVYICIYEIS